VAESLARHALFADVPEAGLSLSLLTGRVTAGTRHLTLVWAVGAVILGLGLLASGRRSQERAVEAGPQTEAGPPTEHGMAGEIRED